MSQEMREDTPDATPAAEDSASQGVAEGAATASSSPMGEVAKNEAASSSNETEQMNLDDMSLDDMSLEDDPVPTAEKKSDSTTVAVENAASVEQAEAVAANAEVSTSGLSSESARVAPTPAESEPEYAWYVLRVASGREDTCSNTLRKKVMLAQLDHLVREIAVPKQKLTEIKDGKRRVRSHKMFPGYIFIHMTLDDDVWYLIRGTSGIGDFLGTNRKPQPMPASEVKKITSIMEEKEESAPEVKIDLVKNDLVKIKEGPFENFDGVIEEVNPAKGMIRVMVTIFGRATPVDLEYWQVEKI